jgi:ABC-2 type transport system permease protein
MRGALAALIIRELLILSRSARGIAALLVPPLFQLLLFGYAATFDVSRVPIAIMNEDQGPEGRELVARFAGSPLFEVVARPARDTDIAALVDGGDVALAVRIGQRFSADLAGGNPADVHVIIDGRLLNTALAVQSHAASVIAGFNRDLIAESGLPRPPAFTVTRAWFNPNLLSHWYVIPGLIAKILLSVTLTTLALAIVRERDLGTFERTLMTPVTPLGIVIGKAVPALLVGFMQGMALAAMAILWFEVPFRGSWLLLAAALVAMLLSAIAIGLLISALARTQAQAILGSFAVLVPAIMLSGFATPIASMPEAVQLLTVLNPIRYFIAITRGLFLRGSDWAAIWPELWPMIVITAAAFTGAYALVRRRMD